MKESGKNQEIDNLIEEEMRTAFGYGKDSLIAEFDQAAEELDDSDRIPPDGEFQKIAAKVHEYEKEQKKSSKKVVRLKRVGKVGLLVAILGCVLMGTGIGASGKRSYEFLARESNQGKSNIWNNTENLESVYEVDEAYEEINKILGVNALKLLYVPEGMVLTEVLYGEGYARMNFTKDGNYIYIIQSLYPVENSSNATSDRKVIGSVLNKNINKNLEIKENLLSEKNIEYSTEFAIDKTYYYLAGVISKEDFELILKKVYYDN